MEPSRRQRLVRHSRFFSTSTSTRTCRLSVHPHDAETFWTGIVCGSPADDPNRIVLLIRTTGTIKSTASRLTPLHNLLALRLRGALDSRNVLSLDLQPMCF